MLCSNAQDGQLIFASSGSIKSRSVLLVSNVPHDLLHQRESNLDQNFVALGTFVLGGAFVTAPTVADDIHPPE